MKKILNEQLKKISISESEIKELKKPANVLIKSLKKEGYTAKIGGSFAKNTVVRTNGLSHRDDSLREPQDIDIFVLFNDEKETKKLKALLKKLNSFGELKEVHGSRNYFQIVCENIFSRNIQKIQENNLQTGVVLEIIPTVKNKDPANVNNITDVSLLHVDYVTKKLKENPSLSDEIKLAKSFTKAQGCYGAESYIKGFSGYSIEILVIYYGSFLKFLRGIQKASVIDSEKYFKSKKEVIYELNSSKLNSPLIIIDPTYKYRNVSAGLSKEIYDKFCSVAKSFLKKPDLDFFRKKEFDKVKFVKNASKNNFKYLEFEFFTEKQEGDIAGTKMKKFFDFIIAELKRQGQEVVQKEFIYEGKGQYASGHLAVKEVPFIEKRGPSIILKEDIEKFKEANKHNEIYLKSNTYYVKKKVKVEDVLEFIKKFEKNMDVEFVIE